LAKAITHERQYTMAFDISQFELLDTAVLTVQNAKDDDDLLIDGKPVKITLYGSGSEQNVRAQYRADNAATSRMQGVFRGKAVKNQAQDSEKEVIEKLVACTAQIDNFPIDGGAQALYSNPKLGYIKRQVIKFLAEDGNFTPLFPTN